MIRSQQWKGKRRHPGKRRERNSRERGGEGGGGKGIAMRREWGGHGQARGGEAVEEKRVKRSWAKGDGNRVKAGDCVEVFISVRRRDTQMERIRGRTGKKKKKKGKRNGCVMSGEQACALRAVQEWVFLGNGGGFGWWEFGGSVERAYENGVKVLALTDHGHHVCTMFSPRDNSEAEEPVHILAYYSSCGPTRPEELEEFLASIRDGRYVRAQNMISKLNSLKMPVKWEHVARIAGKGVAPGRVHVARAMLEAGHVEILKQAFSRYLHDNGPAYSKGSEPLAEDTEIKRSRAFMVWKFIDVMENWQKGYIVEPSEAKLQEITRFRRTKIMDPFSCKKELINSCVSSWLTKEEMQNPELEAIMLNLNNALITLESHQVAIETPPPG
ncbi:unnamed protein product [Rhodiola kirilowii]